MTITASPPAVSPDVEQTPESDSVAALRAMLDDPANAADFDDIHKAIEYLTATSVLGA